jgi:tetratricopeptide (TPR) repeat protein
MAGDFTSYSLLDKCGSRKDQLLAAKAIADGNLLELLTPSGNFQMAERIIKSLLSEDLPHDIQIKLTCDYAISLWRQSRLDEAKLYLLRAMKVSQQEGLIQMEAFAQLNLGMVEVFSCNLKKALGYLKFAEEHGNPLHSIQASLYIPNAYFYYGNVSSCLKTLHHGLARLEQTDDYPEKARVLATKYGFLCDVLLEMDQLEDALSALDKSNAYLELCDFRLIRHNNKIRLADLWARTGRQQAALDLYRATIALAEEHYVPGLFYLSGARILRANGEFKQALELVEQTLKQTKDPPAKADLYLEKGTILALMGSQVFSQKAFRSARDIYRKHGMLQRWRSLIAASRDQTDSEFCFPV